MKKWRNIKLRKIFIILLLLILWRGNAITFSSVRKQFANKPYILSISPDIASKYQTVKIYGHNFRHLPFSGKVLINGKEQNVPVGNWSDDLITIIIDPYQSKTGRLRVVNKYGGEGELESNSVKFTFYNSKTATQEEKERFWESLK